MSILSDVTIKAMIGRGKLVPDGDPARVGACSYLFLPGRIFTAGSDGVVIDWERDPVAGEAERSHFVEPGHLVWIRTKGNVSLPNDVCAFWWQTSTLSRKGLMLVNMSMIEPGYQGPLACLFVNFGSSQVRIAPDTVIAKLVFAQLDEETSSPFTYRMSLSKYDGEVHDGAVNGPATFLRVADMWKDLAVKRAEVEGELTRFTTKATTDFQDAVNRARETGVAKFAEDMKGGLAKSFGWALGGFVIVLAAVTFVPWLQGIVKPGFSKELQDKVEHAVSERLVVPPALQDADRLNQRLSKLEGQLRSMREASPATPDARP